VPIGLALATLAASRLLVALVSEIFVEWCSRRGDLRHDPGIRRLHRRGAGGRGGRDGLGFSGARKNRLRPERGIALGSACRSRSSSAVLVLLSYAIGPTR